MALAFVAFLLCAPVAVRSSSDNCVTPSKRPDVNASPTAPEKEHLLLQQALLQHNPLNDWSAEAQGCMKLSRLIKAGPCARISTVLNWQGPPTLGPEQRAVPAATPAHHPKRRDVKEHPSFAQIKAFAIHVRSGNAEHIFIFLAFAVAFVMLGGVALWTQVFTQDRRQDQFRKESGFPFPSPHNSSAVQKSPSSHKVAGSTTFTPFPSHLQYHGASGHLGRDAGSYMPRSVSSVALPAQSLGGRSPGPPSPYEVFGGVSNASLAATRPAALPTARPEATRGGYSAGTSALSPVLGTGSMVSCPASRLPTQHGMPSPTLGAVGVGLGSLLNASEAYSAWRRTSVVAGSIGQRHFLQALVVPEGQMFDCVVRTGVLTRGRQETSFSIVSAVDGRPLIYVIVNERGSSCRIELKMANETADLLATIRTDMLHSGVRSLPEICHASGETFANLTRSGQDYVLRASCGTPLMTICGDFGAKRIHAKGPKGNEICVTGPRTAALDNAPHAAYYQVQIREGVDAGLMLCALLAVEKVEC